MRPAPNRSGGERGEPAAEKKNCAKAGNRDHACVFRDEKHGELEARVFGVKTGDELRFGFRQIERSAIRLCHGGYKKTEKAENLRKNVPAEQSEVRMPALRRDDVSEIEAVGHEQHADDGKRERELVTHHLRRTAQPSRSEEHTSELQSLAYLVCRLLLEKKKNIPKTRRHAQTL